LIAENLFLAWGTPQARKQDGGSALRNASNVAISTFRYSFRLRRGCTTSSIPADGSFNVLRSADGLAQQGHQRLFGLAVNHCLAVGADAKMVRNDGGFTASHTQPCPNHRVTRQELTGFLRNVEEMPSQNVGQDSNPNMAEFNSGVRC
jgi:hypothetical protein